MFGLFCCRGTLTEFGSVGHHCYHHVHIPMLAVPIRSLPAKGTMNKTVLVIAKDSDEVIGIRNWMDGWSHIFKGTLMATLLSTAGHSALPLIHVQAPVTYTKIKTFVSVYYLPVSLHVCFFIHNSNIYCIIKYMPFVVRNPSVCTLISVLP